MLLGRLIPEEAGFVEWAVEVSSWAHFRGFAMGERDQTTS
jgi:hypothetical protein